MRKKLSIAALALLLCLQSALPLALGESENTLAYVEEMDALSIMAFEITVDQEAWQSMLDNATDKEYIPADITINGLTIENVGIRPKGNSSLSSIARDTTTDRYSFKIKFDEYVDGQTWLGLDKVVINNNFSDATSMKEYLSYDILTYIGVDAPLYAYADVSINGETWGLYLAVEDVDKGYRERVKNGEGELYKPESMEMDLDGGRFQMNGGEAPAMPAGGEGNNMTPPAMDGGQNAAMPAAEGNAAAGGFTMPADGAAGRQRGGMGGGMGGFGGMGGGASALIYTDDNEESYSVIFDNAETKTDSEDHRRVIEALKNLNEGTDLETYVDVDQVLRYIAGHTVVVNLDSYSGTMTHNYLLYENDGQISMIPWDYNMAFGGFMSSDASSVVNFPIDTPVSGASMEDRPMINKLLEVPEYMEQYHAYLQEIMDGYLADGAFAAKVDALDAMISSYVENDPTAFYTYEEYKAAIEELKKLGTLRGESIQGQLDGTVPATTEEQAAQPDKLVDASSVDMQALGSMGGGDWGGGGGGMPGGGDMDTMQKAMEILSSATDGELTEEQTEELLALGLSEEEIARMQQMLPMMQGGGGFGGQ